MRALELETAIGLSTSGSHMVGAGAGARDGLLVVSDGPGGHGTGWLAARVVIRTLCECVKKKSAAAARFVGAADDVPDLRSWAGSVSQSAAATAYEACEGLLGDRAALPCDLPSLLVELDRALARIIPERMRLTNLVAGCTAALVEGAHVRGAHSGIGRALLLRAGALQFESLVQEHYLREVMQRSSMADGREIADLPPNIIASALGCLSTAKVGVDVFDADLALGDVLVMCSARLCLPDDDLAQIVRTAVDRGAPLDELTRRIERAEQEACDASAQYRRNIAFALGTVRAVA